ncbi:MAG: hypothetical protein K2L19_03190 [Eubacterium sp.]|nr:hypothetical protein [Eubacterium sp.]
MLAKYINEYQINTDRRKIVLDDKLIINPTDEQLKAAGYLELIDADCEMNATVSYKIADDKIITVYTPVPEETAEQQPTADNATKEFFETLSSAETNSIAKIRAAAQKYLDDTKEEI